jgi:PP-loop superfamily ATP-utilizing enzyme
MYIPTQVVEENRQHFLLLEAEVALVVCRSSIPPSQMAVVLAFILGVDELFLAKVAVRSLGKVPQILFVQLDGDIAAVYFADPLADQFQVLHEFSRSIFPAVNVRFKRDVPCILGVQ